MPRTPTPDRPVYVVDGSRTPFLKARGRPGPFHAADLALAAGRPLLVRQPFPATALDEVILGCVASGPDEANIARVVALRLGAGEACPAFTVQRNCASGMQAVDQAARDIAAARADLVLAGGTEAMSHHPLLLSEALAAWLGQWRRARTPAARARALVALRPAWLNPVPALLHGLTDPVVGLSMGQTAEVLASEFGISREAMDRFALESHRRAADADWGEELEPLFARDGRVYAADDGIRPDTRAERLARLPPVFDRPVGRVSAGNSAQISDGATLLLLASETAMRRHHLPVLGRLLDSQWAGLAPARMGLGPVYAMAPLFARHGLSSAAIDAWEINEAFAAQVLACLAAWADDAFMARETGLDGSPGAIPSQRLNPDGGAIALGHPVGASGARIVLHLLRVLQHTGGRLGVASICIGGGQGGAVLVAAGESSS